VHCGEGLHQRQSEWSCFPLSLLSGPAGLAVEVMVSSGVTCRLSSPESFLSQYLLNVVAIKL